MTVPYSPVQEGGLISVVVSRILAVALSGDRRSSDLGCSLVGWYTAGLKNEKDYGKLPGIL